MIVTIEYTIDPERAEEFDAVMQETRRRRLAQGALSWTLMRDAADPSRYVEQIVDTCWLEHVRRGARQTLADDALRARRHAFHAGAESPRVTRHLG